MKEKPVERMKDGEKRDKKVDELVELEEFTRKLANDAEKEIRKKLKLPPFKIHRPPKRKNK